MRILLAEDKLQGGNQIEFLLDMAGHQVLHATSGKQALACHEVDPFPVIIADLVFPDLDGFELCRQIRERSRSEYVYVILLVRPSQSFHFEEAEAAGADDVLNLPVNTDMLRARLCVAKRMRDLYEKLDTLSGLLPLCAHCKKIREERGHWEPIETYISSRSHIRFNQTVCPECALREYRLEGHRQPG